MPSACVGCAATRGLYTCPGCAEPVVCARRACVAAAVAAHAVDVCGVSVRVALPAPPEQWAASVTPAMRSLGAKPADATFTSERGLWVMALVGRELAVLSADGEPQEELRVVVVGALEPGDEWYAAMNKAQDVVTHLVPWMQVASDTPSHYDHEVHVTLVAPPGAIGVASAKDTVKYNFGKRQKHKRAEEAARALANPPAPGIVAGITVYKLWVTENRGNNKKEGPNTYKQLKDVTVPFHARAVFRAVFSVWFNEMLLATLDADERDAANLVGDPLAGLRSTSATALAEFASLHRDKLADAEEELFAEDDLLDGVQAYARGSLEKGVQTATKEWRAKWPNQPSKTPAPRVRRVGQSGAAAPAAPAAPFVDGGFCLESLTVGALEDDAGILGATLKRVGEVGSSDKVSAGAEFLAQMHALAAGHAVAVATAEFAEGEARGKEAEAPARLDGLLTSRDERDVEGDPNSERVPLQFCVRFFEALYQADPMVRADVLLRKSARKVVPLHDFLMQSVTLERGPDEGSWTPAQLTRRYAYEAVGAVRSAREFGDENVEFLALTPTSICAAPAAGRRSYDIQEGAFVGQTESELKPIAEHIAANVNTPRALPDVLYTETLPPPDERPAYMVASEEIPALGAVHTAATAGGLWAARELGAMAAQKEPWYGLNRTEALQLFASDEETRMAVEATMRATPVVPYGSELGLTFLMQPAPKVTRATYHLGRWQTHPLTAAETAPLGAYEEEPLAEGEEEQPEVVPTRFALDDVDTVMRIVERIGAGRSSEVKGRVDLPDDVEGVSDEDALGVLKWLGGEEVEALNKSRRDERRSQSSPLTYMKENVGTSARQALATPGQLWLLRGSKTAQEGYSKARIVPPQAAALKESGGTVHPPRGQGRPVDAPAGGAPPGGLDGAEHSDADLHSEARSEDDESGEDESDADAEGKPPDTTPAFDWATSYKEFGGGEPRRQP